MKEIVIVISITTIAMFFFCLIIDKQDKSVELMCRQDCSKMSAEYVHYDMGVNGYKDTCSCIKDGVITPIW